MRSHDCIGVRQMATAYSELFRAHLRDHVLLAEALHWTCGIGEAASEWERLAARADLQPDSRWCRRANALVALARLVGAEPSHVLDGVRGTAPLLPDFPLPAVQASVNGGSPEYFIVDTGSSTSALSRRYCDRQGIAYDAEHVQIAVDSKGNRAPLFCAFIDQISLGDLRVRRCTVNVLEFTSNLRAAGVISPQDLFRGAAVDLNARVLAVTAEAAWAMREMRDAMQVVPVRWDEGLMFVQATINGKYWGEFRVDSGAAASLITTKMARHLRGVPTGSVEAHTAFGQQRVQGPVDVTFAVGSSAQRKTEMYIEALWTDPDAVAPIIRAGTIGFPWFKQRHVILTPDRRHLRFTDTTKTFDLLEDHRR
jgi:predicted aspartyl protease